MAESLVRNESPAEYFRELVDAAIHRQRLVASEFAAFYLVNLLTGFVQLDRRRTDGDEALGVRYVKAMGSRGSTQLDELRHVGDLSLFTAGFFADSLARRLVDVDYYIHIGEGAYGSLARYDATLGDVFDELAEKFTSFVDVLGEVSEHAAVATNTDLLRLYDRWLRTGSLRSGERLVSRGIVPNETLRHGRVQ
jgi:hypothetical protein